MSEVALYCQDRANFCWDSPLSNTVPTGCLQKGLGLFTVGTMDDPGLFTKTLRQELRSFYKRDTSFHIRRFFLEFFSLVRCVAPPPFLR